MNSLRLQVGLEGPKKTRLPTMSRTRDLLITADITVRRSEPTELRGEYFIAGVAINVALISYNYKNSATCKLPASQLS